MSTEPFWITAFLDAPATSHAATEEFWAGVTGYAVSARRGDDGEFSSLVPPAGDDYLRVQRLGSGAARIHLDLHVEDPRAAADAAVGLGATELADLGYVVLASPGGFTFCFVGHPAGQVPDPAEWAAGSFSRVYQVCLDVPADDLVAERDFWAALTGGRADHLERRPEFWFLRPPVPMGLSSLLLQRLDSGSGPVRAHLDVGSSDRPREVARHVALGASVVTIEEFWTVLRDPAGSPYCITDRDPRTGNLVTSATP